MGLRAAILGVAVALASPSAGSVAFLQARQAAGGGFAEKGGTPNAPLTVSNLKPLRRIGKKSSRYALSSLAMYESSWRMSLSRASVGKISCGR